MLPIRHEILSGLIWVQTQFAKFMSRHYDSRQRANRSLKSESLFMIEYFLVTCVVLVVYARSTAGLWKSLPISLILSVCLS